jgi:hypothetical protein
MILGEAFDRICLLRLVALTVPAQFVCRRLHRCQGPPRLSVLSFGNFGRILATRTKAIETELTGWDGSSNYRISNDAVWLR